MPEMTDAERLHFLDSEYRSTDPLRPISIGDMGKWLKVAALHYQLPLIERNGYAELIVTDEGCANNHLISELTFQQLLEIGVKRGAARYMARHLRGDPEGAAKAAAAAIPGIPGRQHKPRSWGPWYRPVQADVRCRR